MPLTVVRRPASDVRASRRSQRITDYGLLTTLLVLGLGTAAQQAPTPSSRTGSHVVHVDAVVIDARGRPLLGLKPTDFELTDEGVAQTIESADTSPSLPSPRLVGIFLDEYHVSGGANTARVREAFARFADDEIRADDVVMVMKPLDSLLSIQLPRGRDAMRAAVAIFAGRKGDYAPRTTFEQNYIGRAPAAVAAARAQMVFASLRTLTTHLGGTGRGRKALVLVSEGFVREMERGRERLADVEAVVRAASRADVAIYTVDPHPATNRQIADGTGGSADEDERGLKTLRTLAERTGGAALPNADSLQSVLRGVTQDLDGYYRLTYRPGHDADGRFHGIAVRVRHPGAVVRARTGYWAPGPVETRFTSETSATPRLHPFGGRVLHTSALIDTWFGIARGADGRTRVTFTWEPRARRGPGSKSGDADIVELSAKTADGTTLFTGRVAPNVAGAPARVAPERAVFEAPPGRLDLDMSIQTGDRRVLDSDARYLEVRSLHGEVTVLTTPEVLRARTLREFVALRADPEAAPIVSRQFRRTERLLIRVSAYGPGDTPPVVEAKLVNRFGQPMRALAALPATRDGVLQFDLSLAPLAPGEYRVELTVTSPVGRAREVISIRVTS